MDEEQIANLVMGDQDSGEQLDQPQEEMTDQLEAESEGIEESEEQASEDQPEFVEIEWDGQLYDVPAALNEAFMKNADYTQKTQELSKEREAYGVNVSQLELQRQQYEFAQSVQSELTQANQFDSQIEQYHQYLRDNVHNLQSNEIERIRLEIDSLGREKTKLQGEIQQRAAEFQQAQQQSRAELLEKSTEVLRKSINGWGEQKQKALREYALGVGYTPQEIDSVIDTRQVLTLWKASEYDRLQKGKSKAVQRVKSSPKRSKPMPKQTQDNLNLRKKLKNPNLSATQKQALAEKMTANILGL